MERKLTEKQKRFIDFYIETGNATEAARKAGYNGNNLDRVGHENLRKLEFHIQEKTKAKDNERIASQDEVLRFLTSVMRNEETEEVVVVESVGDYMSEARTVKKSISAKDRLKAAEGLAKRFGLDKPDDMQDNKIEIILKRE